MILHLNPVAPMERDDYFDIDPAAIWPWRRLGMITIRKASDRGHTRIDWLDSHHSFSFGDYFDPKENGFSVLRVINDDRVAAGQGFGTHPHRDMEIVTYVLEGAVEHRDSLGTRSVIPAGDVQRM